MALSDFTQEKGNLICTVRKMKSQCTTYLDFFFSKFALKVEDGVADVKDPSPHIVAIDHSESDVVLSRVI